MEPLYGAPSAASSSGASSTPLAPDILYRISRSRKDA
jgi:hypothetical protein